MIVTVTVDDGVVEIVQVAREHPRETQTPPFMIDTRLQ
jgi:hypothetical protein